MNEMKLLPLEQADIPQFSADMEAAFEAWFAEEGGWVFDGVHRLSDVEAELKKPGCHAVKAVVDGEILGGATILVNDRNHRAEISFLYVRQGTQHMGLGKKIVLGIEEMFPQVKAWDIFTPYFAKNNLHFYINKCGYKAVEFFNPYHKGEGYMEVTGRNYSFRFEKLM